MASALKPVIEPQSGNSLAWRYFGGEFLEGEFLSD